MLRQQVEDVSDVPCGSKGSRRSLFFSWIACKNFIVWPWERSEIIEGTFCTLVHSEEARAGTMDLNLIHLFLEIVESRSMSAAARKLDTRSTSAASACGADLNGTAHPSKASGDP